MQLSQITITEEGHVQANNGHFREHILVKWRVWCRKLHTFAFILHIFNQTLDLLNMGENANERNLK